MNNTPSEDLYWRLHGLSKILEGSGFIDESKHPDAYATILDAMAFVRGTPQPVVREPLTANQVSGLAESAGYWHGDMSRADFINGIRYAEAAHGITQKGGSNAE